MKGPLKFNLLRYTNSIILGSILGLALTGGAGLIWSRSAWVFDLHRFLGWLLIAMIPWKVWIASRSLRRGFKKTFNRSWMIAISLFLACTAVLVIILGLLWLLRIGPEESWLRQTLISWHWMVGLGLLAPLAVHVWRRWPKPKRVDFLSRRGLLRTFAFGTASLVVWEATQLILNETNHDKRPTGSHDKGSLTGNLFPITNRPDEGATQVDLSTWRLELVDLENRSRSYRYSEILSMPSIEKTAVIDCTLGWYSTQIWKGVSLSDLFHFDFNQAKKIGVRLESLSGYSQTIPFSEARDILLATHVGDQPLNQNHGFPLRAVVPSRRGWFWVKWLARIQLVYLES